MKSVKEQTVQTYRYALLPNENMKGRLHLCHRQRLFGNLHGFLRAAEKRQQLNVRTPQPQVRCARLTRLNKSHRKPQHTVQNTMVVRRVVVGRSDAAHQVWASRMRGSLEKVCTQQKNVSNHP